MVLLWFFLRFFYEQSTGTVCQAPPATPFKTLRGAWTGYLRRICQRCYFMRCLEDDSSKALEFRDVRGVNTMRNFQFSQWFLRKLVLVVFCLFL